MAGSVQFRGKKQVVDAFNNRDVDVWSIFTHKQLLTKGKGAAEFEAFIDLLCEGATNAIYTCKVYEDLDDPRQVKSNTPDDGGFNFRLNSEEMEITNSQYYKMGEVGRLRAEVEDLKKQLEEDDEPEKPNQLGMIGDILEHPSIAPIVPSLLTLAANKLFGTQMPMPNITIDGNTISGIDADDTELKNVITELIQYDPKLLEHLKKLVRLRQVNKGSFDFVIMTIDNMQV